jgi:hypothetical protein
MILRIQIKKMIAKRSGFTRATAKAMGAAVAYVPD